ncbi:NADAR family protein [Paraburkholderia megapolitana]|uniref:NADAR family protein n=1 Tax=Paraburkholderia megapolitana TaxID=420953 RepID=UPI0038B88E53
MHRIGNVTAFFGADDALSNWHPCRFTYHGVDFTSVEQLMMLSKAKLFADDMAAHQILATKDPMAQKMIGRKVKGFGLSLWESRRESIVFVGCREKFSQNPGLRTILLATAPTELVEASPYDLIWGIGLGERDSRVTDRRHWRGRNLLGITLMRVRDTLSRS